MLPGFRFLVAAILLSVSILIFGLGAAALLRAAHEEFASNPSWRTTREARFAQIEETSRPTLAMLRLEPQADAPKMTDVPIGIPLGGAGTASSAPAAAEQPPHEEEKPPVATTISAVETASVEPPPPEAVASDATVPATAAMDRSAVAEEAKVAATEDASPPQHVPPPADMEATPPEQSLDPSAAEPAAPATRLVSLGDQSAAVEETAQVDAKPEQGAARPHLRAHRGKARHKSARARPARLQAAAVQQQPIFPLFEQQVAPQLTPPRKP